MTAAPLIQLGITGLLAALLPLAIVWVSSDANKYRKLVWVTLFFTFDLIIFGAFTRLSDSGLGCPDWPGCYGQANPFGAHADISAAQALLPSGPVTVMKAWIEMTHRYWAMGIGVLIMALMAIAWRMWLKSARKDAKLSPWPATMLLALVCLQGAFGAWTVTLKLQPAIVTMHLLLGLSLLAALTWMAARLSYYPKGNPAAAALRTPAAWALGLLAIQIALGGWVSTNYAALACTDYPLCHGKLIPQMDFAHGFTLWRALGQTAGGEYLPFSALTAIHWSHRTFALVVVAIIVWLALKARHIADLRKSANWLLLAIVVQFILGVLTIYLQWPLLLALAHNGCAALLVALLVMVNCKARILAQAADASVASC